MSGITPSYRRRCARFFRTLPYLTASFLLAFGAALPVHADRASDCAAASSLTANTTDHQYGTSVTGVEIFKFDPSSTGILRFDVTSPGSDSVRPKLTVYGSSCVTAGGAGTDYNLIASTPTEAVLQILDAAETYYLQIEPEDSSGSLSGYKLRTTFVSEPTTIDESVSPSTEATDTCSSSSTDLASSALDGDYISFSESIDQWDEDVLAGAMAGPGVLTLASSGEDLAVDIYTTDDCQLTSATSSEVLVASGGTMAQMVDGADYSIAIGPANGADGSYTLSAKHYDFCAPGESDDHSDVRPCGSVVVVDGSSVSGSLAATYDDDDDFFYFVLSSQITVEVETTGTTDTFGSLYDEAGQLLASNDDASVSDSNFRIVRTMGPGRYFVRVEGASGAEGSYSVAVSESP